jgi:hypothetical protein
MEEGQNPPPQRPAIMKYFGYLHLPQQLQQHSSPFADLADRLCDLPASEERDVALRKLLEAKDAAVRAAMNQPSKETTPAKPGPDYAWDDFAKRWVQPGAKTGPAITTSGVGA